MLSNFIDVMLKNSLRTKAAGFIINPWSRSFLLTNELIGMIFEADGGVEYSVPDDPITAELLEDGSYLKRAIEICNRNRTKVNILKLFKILRDSWVWTPCNAVLSDADHEAWSKVVLEAGENGDLDSLVGHEFTNKDDIRFIPDILQSGNDYFFPVFTSEEEMGEYGEHFSKLGNHFLEAANLARNNKKNVIGIVINPFSDAFTVPKEMFDIIAGMDSAVEPD
ncbi:MAG: SseB family protein [Ruminiclostridium sp.]|nr:SseB family protein [Ruminiclostridium sp.]